MNSRNLELFPDARRYIGPIDKFLPDTKLREFDLFAKIIVLQRLEPQIRRRTPTEDERLLLRSGKLGPLRLGTYYLTEELLAVYEQLTEACLQRFSPVDFRPETIQRDHPTEMFQASIYDDMHRGSAMALGRLMMGFEPESVEWITKSNPRKNDPIPDQFTAAVARLEVEEYLKKHRDSKTVAVELEADPTGLTSVRNYADFLKSATAKQVGPIGVNRTMRFFRAGVNLTGEGLQVVYQRFRQIG